jgi:NAD(P)H-dependent FMN reductase
MKITVIIGTEVRGCTYQIKELFLEPLREGNEVREFYLPKDLPHFCCGCKTCFLKSEQLCPHAEYIRPIWEAILDSDLLVFTSPVYALRTTGQMKALLDHLCVHWMVHRPEEKMFGKRAVILTNAIGVFNGGAQKDIATSLVWLGVSDIKKLGVGLMEGVVWDELSDKRRNIIAGKVRKLAERYKSSPGPARRGIKVSALFALTKKMHQSAARQENPLSADNQHWLDKGWIKL